MVADPQTNARIFPTLTWAAYLKDWPGPAEGERPTAYIVVLLDTTLADNLLRDDGIAAQTILLGAVEKGLGGCIVASLRRDALREALNVPEALAIRFVITLGKPAETVVLEELPSSGDIRYWRDDLAHHHVLKRPLKDLIVAGKKEVGAPRGFRRNDMVRSREGPGDVRQKCRTRSGG